MTDSGASLSRNTALMASGTLLSRLTGYGRVAAAAYALGQTTFSDTYVLANNIPNIVFELLLGGVLAGSLVPVFVRERTKSADDAEAWRVISAVVSVAAVILAAMTVVLIVAAPFIVDLYTLGKQSPDIEIQRDTATFLLRLFVPQLAFYGFISIATGVLNAHRRFAPPMFAPILNNIVVIGTLLAVPHLADDVSLEAMSANAGVLTFLGLGTTAGVLAMGAALLPGLRSIAQGRLRWRWDVKHEAVRTVGRMSGWTIGLAATNQVALWIMLTLAIRESGGATAFLNSFTFFMIPHGVFAVSVITALAPELAEQWTRENLDRFRGLMARGLRLILFVMVPAGVGFALLATPIIEVILERGEFTAADTDQTAKTLLFMALGLPGFSAFVFITRAFQSMTDARSAFVLYVMENGINVVAALVLWGQMGVSGLALSQSIAYSAGAVLGYLALRKRTKGLRTGELISVVARVALCAAAMTGAVLAVRTVLPDSALLTVIAGTILGAVVYFVAAHVARLSEAANLLTRLKQVLPTRKAGG